MAKSLRSYVVTFSRVIDGRTTHLIDALSIRDAKDKAGYVAWQNNADVLSVRPATKDDHEAGR